MKIKMILNRFYTNDIDASITFYEKLFTDKCTSRFHYEKMNLEIARVGSVLIIAGTDDALSPFRTTQATFLVDSIHDYRTFLIDNGVIIIRDLQEVPTGINMTVQHRDGTIVEYVEHR